MKKLKFLSLLLIATMLFVVSCKDDTPPEPPVQVGFKYAPENPIAGDLITFTNSSNGGTTFAWDFGDGNTSTDKNPTHTYTKSGKYTVVLKVDNKDDQTYSKEIEVADALPVFSYTPDPIQVGIGVTFTATIYNPDNAAVEYTWTFDPNNVVSDDLD
ncbi:MAG TPA: PKD domain-containing protein, partial [Bacteroidetes bacterium]|nr:PKD domain-containing protein [Bacteroidota bacterium]